MSFLSIWWPQNATLASKTGKVERFFGKYGSNKVLTVFGRTEPKDFIDLYIILHNSKLTFQQLFDLAKQKDLGLSEFYLANAITQIERIHTWPFARVPIDVQSVVHFFLNIAHTLYDQIKPK